MNRTVCWVAIFITFLSLLDVLAVAEGATPLVEAIEKRQIEAEVTGLGGSTGDALLLSVRRLTAETVRITLEPGTVFKSVSGNAQDMLIGGIKGERLTDRTYRPLQEILLGDNAKHAYVLEAYCLNFHKENPSPTDIFRIGPPDERARQILSTARTKRASLRAIQSALWIDRDKVSSSDLKRRFPVNDEDIEEGQNILRSIGQSQSKEQERPSLLPELKPKTPGVATVSGDWDRELGQARDYQRGMMVVGAISDLRPNGWKQTRQSDDLWDKILYTSRLFTPLDRKRIYLARLLLGLGGEDKAARMMSLEPGWEGTISVKDVIQRCDQPNAVINHPDGKWAIAVFGPFGLKFNIESGYVTGILVPYDSRNEFSALLRGTDHYASRQWPSDKGSAEMISRMVMEYDRSAGKARAEAAEVLGWSGDSRAVPALLRGLDESDEWVVISCCGALQQLPDKSAVESLVRLVNLQKECGNTLPAMAVHALANTGDRRAITAIISALRKTTESSIPNNAPDFKQEYAEYLHKLTGQDFGKDADRWEGWFRTADKNQ